MDASEATLSAVTYLRSQRKIYSEDFAFVFGNIKVAPMKHRPIKQLKLQAAVRTDRLREEIVQEY